jgi:quinol monooxygenase YgiN
MIIIGGTADLVDPTKRDEAISAAAPWVSATREQEAGCLAYAFSADSVRPERIVIYELWEDAATLDAHFLHENYFQMRELLHSFGPMTTQATKYRIDASDPVYGEDRIATSRFWSTETR